MPEDRANRQSMVDTERSLLRAYRNGDPEALGELVKLYRKPLYAFIMRMVGKAEEADDIFQEVWFRAIRNMKTFQPNSLVSWLFRIAHNAIIDRARHRKVSGLVAPFTEETSRWVERFADPQPGPDRATMAREIEERIAAAVAALPPEQREVFSLRMEADLPFKEIAAIQGVSINTALARMQYALAKVRQALSRENGNLEQTP